MRPPRAHGRAKYNAERWDNKTIDDPKATRYQSCGVVLLLPGSSALVSEVIDTYVSTANANAGP